MKNCFKTVLKIKLKVENFYNFCEFLQILKPQATMWRTNIGGFRDTYLGRQVVSRRGGPRAGIGSAGGMGALRDPLVGSGAEPGPAEIEFAAF